MVDRSAKIITVQSDGGLTMRMKRSRSYCENMKADIGAEKEMKIIGAKHLAASTAMTAIEARVAMLARRNGTTSAVIAITIAPTVDTMI